MTRGLNTSSVLELPAEIHWPGKCSLLHRIHRCTFRGHCLMVMKFISLFLCVKKGMPGLVPQLEGSACVCLAPAGTSARVIILNCLQWSIFFFCSGICIWVSTSWFRHINKSSWYTSDIFLEGVVCVDCWKYWLKLSVCSNLARKN